MKEALQKSMASATRDFIMQVREHSIFGEQGRIFLDAAAMTYGARVEDGKIVDARGNVIDEMHPDYTAIVNMAKKQARAESPIGRDLIGA